MKLLSYLLTFLLLFIPGISSADDGIRIFGGIGISSGNLRIYITDDYSNHFHQPKKHHYRQHIPGRSYHYGHRDYQPRHWNHRRHYPVHQTIIIRDPGLYDYRKYRHHRSYRYR